MTMDLLPRIPEHNLGHFVKWVKEQYASNVVTTTILPSGEFEDTTYGQLFADMIAWCAFFKEHGVKEGERVAMIATKCPRHYVFFYACWYMGAIAVPVCETMGEQEMGFILNDSDPVFVLADKAAFAKVQKAAGERPVIPLDEMPLHTQLPSELPPPSDVPVDSVAVLIYTSGSTGMPKGVMLSHKALYINGHDAYTRFNLRPHDRLLSVLPYWHSYGLVCEILTIPLGGMTCEVPQDLRDFKKNLAKYAPDVMIAVPRVAEIMKGTIEKAVKALPPKQKALVDRAIYNASRIFTARPQKNGGIFRMLYHKFFYDPLVFRKFRKAFGGRLRFIVVGGAPMDLEGQIFFKFLGVTILVGYGLTETSPIISSNLPDDHKLNSCGHPFPWLRPENGGDFTFKDDEGHMGKDVHGALLVKGDCVMKGYWRHKDASAKTFEDGWLNTGDIAYCDSDGFIHIDGRKGNLLVLVGGEKFHPEFIEDAIRGSANLVSEVMVIGERCKNVYALVNVHKELIGGLTPEQLHDKVKQEVQAATAKLTTLERPKDVLVLPDFNLNDGTLTATLKIRRYKIRELYRDQIQAFLESNGEDVTHKVNIDSSRVMESI
ncbi:MAG: AMP-binding protein [Victivallales bacterium]|nr:AMP-binding protein [Victivallales bacterium]